MPRWQFHNEFLTLAISLKIAGVWISTLRKAEKPSTSEVGDDASPS